MNKKSADICQNSNFTILSKQPYCKISNTVKLSISHIAVTNYYVIGSGYDGSGKVLSGNLN